jgi:hypothetical protein
MEPQASSRGAPFHRSDSFLAMKQKRFTKEFEEEAVRLLRTSGRTEGEISEVLASACRP